MTSSQDGTTPQAGFTPGEWTYDPEDQSIFVSTPGGFRSITHLKDEWSDFRGDEALANARLIAEAPAMHFALVQLRAMAERLVPHADGAVNHDASVALDLIDPILARAEGRSV